MRHCNGCTLCCKLLPMHASRDHISMDTIEKAIAAGMLTREQAVNTISNFSKPAGQRCPYQKASKGCVVYDKRPFGCRFWNCRWLTNDDTADLSRPDRSHYVIDVSPDYVTSMDAGRRVVIPVIQIWCDSDYPDAHRDPDLRAYLLRQSHNGWAALIRFSDTEAARKGRQLFLVAPPMTTDGKWHEIIATMDEKEHTVADKIAAIGPMSVVLA